MLDCPVFNRVHWPDLHSRFGEVLPTVQSESRSAFAGLRTAEDREDAEADAALAAWMRFLRAAAASTIIDPVDLARRAVASVSRRLRMRAMLAA
ncbi:MAG: hypothetical protein U0791_20445 [Gemmataceae bacterium]